MRVIFFIDRMGLDKHIPSFNFLYTMANLKSSIKDTRRIITRTARNRSIKSRLKTLRQNLSESVENKDKTEIKEATKNYVSALDKAVKRGIIHRNKASRHKSEYSKYLG